MTSGQVFVGVIGLAMGWMLAVGYGWWVLEPRARREKEQRELTERVAALERKS